MSSGGEMLKDKLEHIKILSAYLRKNWFEPGNDKLEVVRNTHQTGPHRDTFIEKNLKNKTEVK